MSASDRTEFSPHSDSDVEDGEREEEEGEEVQAREEQYVEAQPTPSLVMRLPPATSAAPAVSVNPAQPGLPLAVTILSSPGALLVVDDASTLMPAMFALYRGEGGERVRALYHSMLTEYKTNVDNAYMTQGTIKSALFVAFVELCCAFTAEPTEEVCAVIVDTTTAFMTSIRSLFKGEVERNLSKYESTARDSVSEQLHVATQLFPETCDTHAFRARASELDFFSVPAMALERDQMNMFVLMHEFAKSRDATFYNYAKFVQAQVVVATKEGSVYVAHIFLRYFIYTLMAVCRLAAFDYAKTREAFKDPNDTVANYYKYKIDSRLHSNFGDLCSYLLVKEFRFESHIRAEHQLYVTATSPPKPDPPRPVSSSAASMERFRPQMAIPTEDPAQQGGSCLML